jgi:hypothetical protein
MFYKYPSWALAMLLPILAWLMFDSLVIAIGNLLGEGSLLEVLSWLRFLLRALITPFLIVIAFDQAKRAGVKWTDDILVMLGCWLVIAALVTIGIVRNVMGLAIEVVQLEGIKQYREVQTLGLPIAIILAMLIVSLLGLGIWFKIRSPWLLLGGVVMLAGIISSAYALPSALIAATNIVLSLGFLLVERKLQEISPTPAIR